MRNSIYHNPYIQGRQDSFIRKLNGIVKYHYQKNQQYRKIMEDKKISPKLKSWSDVINLPALPADLFKRNSLFTVPTQSSRRFTSTGTGKVKTQVYYDDRSLKQAKKMVISMLRYHNLIRWRPSDYIVFGYQPYPGNQHGSVQVQQEFLKSSPAKKIVYSLRYQNGGYQSNEAEVLELLKPYRSDLRESSKWSGRKIIRHNLPVRLIGYPSLLYQLLEEIDSRQYTYQLPKGSLILTGGGWKGMADQEIAAVSLRKRAHQLLGISPQRMIDLYSAVEMPALFIECRHHRMHIPNYFRIIIRDPISLQPLPFGQPGLINVISTFVTSMPLHSILMSDIGILSDQKCACGCRQPHLTILGRTELLTVEGCAKQVIDIAKGGKA